MSLMITNECTDRVESKDELMAKFLKLSADK